MNHILMQLRWKSLLAVFKIKRLAHKWFGMSRLDYGPKDIFILTDTIREYQTRANSVAKEPKTVSWIEENLGPDAVLYDIGANVGAYSLIAAARGIKVFAFEPAHQNVYKLHENILLNKLSSLITVVPLMLAARDGVSNSIVKDKSFGASHTFSFQEKSSSQSDMSQTFLAIGLDTCIKTFSLPEPTMIKIDVDGAEVDVLNGAHMLLKNPKLQTMLIETDRTTSEAVKRICTDMGFKIIDEEKFDDKNGTINYIFKRG